MQKPKTHPTSIVVGLGAVACALWLLVMSPGTVTAGNGGSTSAWSDDFNGGQLNSKFWVVSNGSAPGAISNQHQGYFTPANVTVSNSYLVLKLTQQAGTVGTNSNGVISYGGQVRTRHTYGYGTYTWTMRMSSTSSTPTGSGSPDSGSVSAGFLYVNNSQTEIDFEFPGDSVDTLYLVNWLNPNPAANPTSSDETYSTVSGLNVASLFHTYKFVWQPGRIDYYVDGGFQVSHTTNVPSAPAYFMMNHWGTDSPDWGGPATLGETRYFYIDSVSYSP
jgi:beta-glucanase (GH16 family)